ncbi:MAG: DUF2194 domain-containing protein [Velocimicrobium sp.]
MVSRRNFLTITIIMLVILFMFQSSGVIKENWNDYEINSYAKEDAAYLSSDSLISLESMQDDEQKNYVIYLGNTEDNGTGSVVKQWCTYSKRRVIVEKTLEDCIINKEKPPEVILLDSNYVNWNNDIDKLKSMIDENINFIFCNLPAINVIGENEALKKMLGVMFVSEPNVSLEGIKLFEGFLLGGEEWYITDKVGEDTNQDMNLEIPWYSLTSGTKTYMVGMLDKTAYPDVKNEYLPAIIWRNSIGKSRIFAVNGDYLSTNTGIGILDAMMAELNEYEIYPIVNAQTIVALNNPVLEVENDVEMNQRYSRSSDVVFRDIVWPGIVSIITKMKASITCMLAPQLDYADNSEPNADQLEYYFKLVSEQKGEIGISGTQVSNLAFTEKLKEDDRFLNATFPNYKFTTFYADSIPLEEIIQNVQSPILRNVKTVLEDYDEHKALASYATKDIMVLNATINGFSHTFEEDFRMKSLQTALGYSTIIADMKRVLYPNDNGDEWENLYKDFSRYTITYWKKFSSFDQTTLSESDIRMRNFLAMDFSDNRKGNCISLSVKNLKGEGWFLLRTHDESISNIKGGTYEKIEKNAYIILAQQDVVAIDLQKDEDLFYYN